MEYTCPHCKNPIYDNDALLCLYCGESLKRGIGFMGKIKYPVHRIIIIIISIFVLICFILLVAGCNTASAQSNKDKRKYTKGEIYPDMTKRAIRKAGYTKKLRKEYYKTGKKEWIIYDNYATEEEGDLVVFYLVGGKLKSWFAKEALKEEGVSKEVIKEEETEEKNKE